jgi:hypothetical protein
MKTKICSNCKVEKDVCDFGKKITTKDGFQSRIKNYMRFNKISLGTGSLELVGLTAEDLKKYIESKFKEGMSWDNYGVYGWHLDHIIPLSSAKNEEGLKSLCHYTNLQQLWVFDNLSKFNKIIVD